MDANTGNICTKLARRADTQPLAGSARTGFTLVELLMVLGVLVVLASLTLPAMLRWQRGMPMEQAISTLQLQLQETRLAAIRSGEPWSLTLPQAGKAGHRHPVSESRTDDRRMQFQWPAGIQCEDSRARDAREIVFQADGVVSERRLKLVDQHGHQTILRIDRLTGQATIVKERQQASRAAGRHRGVQTC